MTLQFFVAWCVYGMKVKQVLFKLSALPAYMVNGQNNDQLSGGKHKNSPEVFLVQNSK